MPPFVESKRVSTSVVHDFLRFVNNAWTPFHATREVERMLLDAGYQQLSERDHWQLELGGKYFVTRNMSSVIAFAIGHRFVPGEGFWVVGAHTDSPCPKLKPVSKVTRAGCLMVGVQPYGGGIWHTWFDRDLSVAGRVMVKKSADQLDMAHCHGVPDGNGHAVPNGNGHAGANGGNGHVGNGNGHIAANGHSQKTSVIASELVLIRRPIMRIPTLAIHLDRSVNDGFAVNFQNHMGALLATSIKSEVNRLAEMRLSEETSLSGSYTEEDPPVKNAMYAHGKVSRPSRSTTPTSMAKVEEQPSHHPVLLQILADELECKPSDICDFELCVCDTQPSVLAGALNEFIFSGRLDNLAMTYCSTKALLESTSAQDALYNERGVRMVALFDNEEVGSNSAQGACSTLMRDAMTRITEWAAIMQRSPFGITGLVEQASQNSFVVSADMGHALHPNYQDKHDEAHQPKMQGGLVIKHNAAQRYATTAVTACVFREIAKRRSIPVQDFVVRSDLPCGSTIGPSVATRLGIRTVDVGAPQLSMHSVREMCGADDIDHSFRHLKAYFESVGDLLLEIVVDE
eukprot:TRINITY_DN1085_c0_g1_i2.p1 TRINITY_DN1085_c0_g1~~TRINITY_DN1085_c0_g1_i2.p1  ORF type:complete len:571 (+),score=102.59 TRINITY_DN1085_c0_g1_i2:221-1933(+)